MNEIRQAADLLRRYNAWRCGDEAAEAVDPAYVTRALNLVCDALEQSPVTPSEALAMSRLSVEAGKVSAQVAQAQDQPKLCSIPEELVKHPDTMASQQFVDGWNACRDAMISSAQKHGGHHA